MGDVSKKLINQFATNLNTMLDKADQRHDRGGRARIRARRCCCRRRDCRERCGDDRRCRAPRRRPGGRRPSRRPRHLSLRLPRGPAGEAHGATINGPAADPIELSDVAGSAIAQARAAAHRRARAAVDHRCVACASDRDSPRDDVAAVAASCSAGRPEATSTSSSATPRRPVVMRNAPLLDDGRPMPTRYWLDRQAPRSAPSAGWKQRGAVRRAEAEIDPLPVADAHARYAAERDAATPARTHAALVRTAASAARAPA